MAATAWISRYSTTGRAGYGSSRIGVPPRAASFDASIQILAVILYQVRFGWKEGFLFRQYSGST